MSNKIVTIVISCCCIYTFLFQISSGALDDAVEHLSPTTRLSRQEFLALFKACYTCLSNKAVNAYIGSRIREAGGISYLRHKWERTLQIEIDGSARTVPILIAGIPGLFKNTNQFGHIGRGTQNGILTAYIDSNFIYDEEIIQALVRHEENEIRQYEKKRVELENTLGHTVSYEEMKAWHIKHRDFADEAHGSSEDLSWLYERAEREYNDTGSKFYLDLDAIYDLYLSGGFNGDDGDINITAGKKGFFLWLSGHVGKRADWGAFSDLTERKSIILADGTECYVFAMDKDFSSLATDETLKLINQVPGGSQWDGKKLLGRNYQNWRSYSYALIDINRQVKSVLVAQREGGGIRVTRLSTHDSISRQGAATALLRHLASTLDSEKAITVDTLSDNDKANALYDKLGFTLVGVTGPEDRKEKVYRIKAGELAETAKIDRLGSSRQAKKLAMRDDDETVSTLSNLLGERCTETYRKHGVWVIDMRTNKAERLKAHHMRLIDKSLEAIPRDHLKKHTVDSIVVEDSEKAPISSYSDEETAPAQYDKAHSSCILFDISARRIVWHIWHEIGYGVLQYVVPEKIRETLRELYHKSERPENFPNEPEGFEYRDFVRKHGAKDPHEDFATIYEELIGNWSGFCEKVTEENRALLGRKVDTIKSIFPEQDIKKLSKTCQVPKAVDEEWSFHKGFVRYAEFFKQLFPDFRMRLEGVIERRLGDRCGETEEINYMDVSEGVGCAPTEASARWGDIGLRSYLVCPREWTADDFKPEVREHVVAVAEERGVTTDLFSRQFDFIQTGADDACLEEKLQGRKMDVITFLASAIFYNDPLKAIVNLYNNLKEGGLLFTEYGVPKTYSQEQREQLLGVFAELANELRAFGINAIVERFSKIRDVDVISLVIKRSNSGKLKLNWTPSKVGEWEKADPSRGIVTKTVFYEDNDGPIVGYVELPQENAEVKKRDNSPAACLQAIRDDDNLINRAMDKKFGISASMIAKARCCSMMDVLREFEILNDLGLLVMLGGRRYCLSDIFIGEDINYSKAIINLLCDVSYEIGKSDAIRVLHSWDIERNMRKEIRQILKLHVTSYVHARIDNEIIKESPYVIKIWKGYAGPSQQGILTKIRTMTEGNPYEISFEEIDDLVSFASDPNNINEMTVTILPYGILSVDQRGALYDSDARIIYADLDREELGANDAIPIEALIALGKAYLSDDALSFYKIYRILTQQIPREVIPLGILKEDPICTVTALQFIIKPISAHDTSELKRINTRMLELLTAA